MPNAEALDKVEAAFEGSRNKVDALERRAIGALFFRGDRTQHSSRRHVSYHPLRREVSLGLKKNFRGLTEIL